MATLNTLLHTHHHTLIKVQHAQVRDAPVTYALWRCEKLLGNSSIVCGDVRTEELDGTWDKADLMGLP